MLESTLLPSEGWEADDVSRDSPNLINVVLHNRTASRQISGSCGVETQYGEDATIVDMQRMSLAGRHFEPGSRFQWRENRWITYQEFERLNQLSLTPRPGEFGRNWHEPDDATLNALIRTHPRGCGEVYVQTSPQTGRRATYCFGSNDERSVLINGERLERVPNGFPAPR